MLQVSIRVQGYGSLNRLLKTAMQHDPGFWQRESPADDTNYNRQVHFHNYLFYGNQCI
jgi:hypothetical protein